MDKTQKEKTYEVKQEATNLPLTHLYWHLLVYLFIGLFIGTLLALYWLREKNNQTWPTHGDTAHRTCNCMFLFL